MKYPNLTGRWHNPARKNYRWMCCDCRAVHRISFRMDPKDKRRIQIKIVGDRRATGQARRWLKAKAAKK